MAPLRDPDQGCGQQADEGLRVLMEEGPPQRSGALVPLSVGARLTTLPVVHLRGITFTMHISGFGNQPSDVQYRKSVW